MTNVIQIGGIISNRNNFLPRIVSADMKNSTCQIISRPRISGLLKIISEGSDEIVQYAEIRNGCLIIHGRDENSEKRRIIQLRCKNLKYDSKLKQFSLINRNESAPVAKFQVIRIEDYKRWLKIIAVEIIRQTPLHIVKYLDIFSVHDLFQKDKSRNLVDKKSYFVEENECNNNYKFVNNSDENRSKKPVDTSVTDNYIDNNNYSLKVIVDNNNYCHKSPIVNSIDYHNHDEKENQFVDLNRRHSLEQPDLTKNIRNSAKLSNNNMNRRFSNDYNYLPDVLKDLPLRNSGAESVPCYLNEHNINGSPFTRNSSGSESVPCYLNRINNNSNELESEKNFLVDLLKRCHTDEQYVPVREKKILFETLSRFSLSVDNLMRKKLTLSAADEIKKDNNHLTSSSPSVKCHSFHDLSTINKVPVKDICRYFEKNSPKSVSSSSLPS